MKSDICPVSQDTQSLVALLAETEKAAAYSGLDKKQTGRLRLLAEELVEMLPELLSFSSGNFWVESENKNFELHVSLVPDEKMTLDRRDKVLSVSSSGKNAAAVGVLTKIKLAAEFMLIDYEQTAVAVDSFYECGMMPIPYENIQQWSLNTYRNAVAGEKGEQWDELEKSIIANIADDVLVGLQGKKVDIVVKKQF